MRTESTPPTGCTWARYLDELCEEHGGLTALTHLLIRRAKATTPLPDDPGSIERALRRLRGKGNAPGGQYGRWLLKYFGVPRSLADTARWMGQYHSRFSDLPIALRESQLWLWDRPPIAESPIGAWIHLGLAGVALARGHHEDAVARLARATAKSESAACAIEGALLEARLASDRRLADETERALGSAEALIPRLSAGIERESYRARLLDQQAYAFAHARPARLEDARRSYAAITANSSPFIAFRRCHGLAYCDWKLGRKKSAISHARAALDHAGDAGMLRFREQALRLLAHLEPRHARRLRARAAAISLELRQGDPFDVAAASP